jgi:hypothetical protein
MHTIIEIQLVAMIALHTLAWPYQKKIHNIIDLLLFANLAIINSLKLLKFFYTENGAKSRTDLKRIRVTGRVFIYIPILVLFLVIIYVLARILKTHFPKISRVSSRDIELEESRVSCVDPSDDFLEDHQRSLYASDTYHRIKRMKSDEYY